MNEKGNDTNHWGNFHQAKKSFCAFGLILFFSAFQPLLATKLVEIKVVDKDYIMIYFKDGDCVFVDDGIGADAYTATHQTDNNFIVSYGDALHTTNAVNTTNWNVSSTDDTNYGSTGLSPANAYRKSKLNGMAELDWGSSDWNYEHSMEHFIYLNLPSSLVQGNTYTVEINSNTNTDVTTYIFTYDIFNCITEAIHVNLNGYIANNSIKAADLYLWLGNGGARDYSDFEGNNVYIYNVNTQTSQQVGTVAFWKSSTDEAHGYNFTESDVWNADFTGFYTPGTYRLAIDGVGCSEDFVIDNEIYHDPFMVNTQGYYYMRIGEDRLDMEPVPRRPLYIPGSSPANTTVYITTMEYTHPQWGSLVGGDVWDAPNAWAPFSTGRTNPNAYGGHSDALDWDRHLSHVSSIYDLLLPYILSYGVISDDDLDIGESGNGIPDIIDEAQNEVDFWLRLRDGMGYSCGLTNPNSSNVLYQAGCNAIAAWANAANCAMLAECYRIAGETELMTTYLDSAVVAYNYAGTLSNQMLDYELGDGGGSMRGRDFKMTAAAFLYNLTGDTNYENVVNSESEVTGSTSAIINLNTYNQIWATAGYLKTNRTVNYPTLFDNMKASVIYDAINREANYTTSRPTRRSTDSNLSYFHTAQNVHRTILAHAVATEQSDLELLENALILEADWGLGRNPANLIQMTTASTPLSSKRSIDAAYTSGHDDGSAGQHPGHTPYLNMNDWGTGMITARPSWLGSMSYPSNSNWPVAEQYFNTRYVWAHTEFTPQQTMRGKQALYGYLYALGKGISVVPVSGVSVHPASGSISGSETMQLTATVTPTIATYKTVTWSTNDSLIATVSSTGLVTGGVSSGVATITATTVDGGLTSTSRITVAGVSVDTVSVNPSSASINVNNTQQLTATITPINASDKRVTWSSSNNSIATVNSNGLVSGIAQGNATVTATTNDGGKTDTCHITVNYISLIDVSINTGNSSMFIGETQQLTAIYTPSDATNKTVTWSSSNESVATVNTDGLVTAVGAGSTTITVTAQDGGMTDTFEISVQINSDIIIYRDANSVINYAWNGNGTLTELSTGGSEGVNQYQFSYSLSGWWSGLGLQFSAVDVSALENLTIDFNGPASGHYTYVYLVDDDGNTSDSYDITRSTSYTTSIIPLSELQGETSLDLSQITEIGINVSGASSGSGSLFFDNIYFDNGIDISVTGVSVSPTSATINGDNTQQLTATIQPENASNTNVTWSSSNTACATVNASGLVSGVSPGTASITVTTVDGGFTDICSITVSSVNLQGIAVNPSTISISTIENQQLSINYTPDNASNKTVSWISSNTAVATVSANGLVQGIAEGTSTITATSAESSHTSSCEVTVTAAPEEIVIYRDQGGIVQYVWDTNGTLTELSSGGQEGNEHYQYNYSLSNWWDGIGFNFPEVNVSQYEYLVLAISGPTSSSNFIDVNMSDGNSEWSDVVELTRTTSYSLIEIPLSELEGTSDVDLTSINHIMLGVSGTQTGTGTFYVDNIYFGGPVAIVPVSGIEINPATATIDGGTQKLTANVLPANATNKNISWSSSNSAIASVNSTGSVMGNSVGTATITVTSEDGEFTASSEITVTTPTQGRVLKVMPLGNSITQGDGRAASYLVPGGYRLPLWQNLVDEELDCGFEFVGSLTTNPATGLEYSNHEGHSGWTTGQILSNIDTYMSEATPDIVMMHLGTNDVAQDVVAQAPANLRGLIDHICAALPADGKLYVSTNIPMGGVGSSVSIAYNNLIIDAVTEKQGESLPVYLVDAYSMWQNEYYDAWGESNCDWTHPGQLGYNALGDFWFDVIKDDVQLPCNTTIPVTGVSIDTTNATIKTDSTIQLSATILPENATNKNVAWSSSDEQIATVNSSGLVTGIDEGTATITVTTNDGDYTATTEITVTEIQARVLKIMTLGNSITYGSGSGTNIPGGYRLPLWQDLQAGGLECGVDFVGSLSQNSATGLDDPDHEGHPGFNVAGIANNLDTYLAANSPDIVLMHIGTNNVIQGSISTCATHMAGMIDKICAVLPSDGKLYLAQIIPVKNEPGDSALTVALNSEYATVVSQKQLDGLPVYLVDAHSIWSDDYFGSDMIHPNQEGYNALGDFWFDVIKDDVQLPCGISVVPVTGVTVDPVGATINIDSTIQITHNVLPENATNKNVAWSSSDELIATVNSSGLVTGIAEGTAVISCTSIDDSECKATINFTVNSTVLDNISVNNTTLIIGDIECYNALQSITVAGNSGVVEIENGATAEYIAGESVSFLPGFHAQEGSQVNATITTDNSFCTESSPQSIVSIQSSTQNSEENTTLEESLRNKISEFKVYPNPNTGIFKIDLQLFEQSLPVIIYNQLGQIIFNENLEPVINEINIAHLQKGIYFIRTFNDNEQAVKKIIVK